MKNKKNILFLQALFVLVMLFVNQVVCAEDGGINFTIKNDGSVVFSGTVPLPTEGNVNISDTEGNTQEVNARSVLNIIKNADDISSNFNISNLIYYSSFSAFYLKCINVNTSGELCDNWMYKVNGTSPDSGMDQNILSGGEELVLFFDSDEPEVVDEPVEVVEESHASSSGSSSGSRVVQIPIEENKLAEVVPVAVTEEKIITPTKEVKVVSTKSVNKAVKNKKPVVQNTASVVSALDPKDTTTTEPKTHWYQRFFGWLFGF